jgi:transcriptional regulator with XRE-family HTH domain
VAQGWRAGSFWCRLISVPFVDTCPGIESPFEAMAQPNDKDWHRLARMVVSRRVALGYRQRQAFAEQAGLSLRTLDNIEHARRTSYDAATLATLEQALQWEPDSVESILDGGDALPPPATDEAADNDAELQALYRVRDQLEDAIRQLEAKSRRATG